MSNDQLAVEIIETVLVATSRPGDPNFEQLRFDVSRILAKANGSSTLSHGGHNVKVSDIVRHVATKAKEEPSTKGMTLFELDAVDKLLGTEWLHCIDNKGEKSCKMALGLLVSYIVDRVLAELPPIPEPKTITIEVVGEVKG